MRHHRIRQIAPSVPTASMADIAFLLIIFFMLTTSFSPERTNVTLPSSDTQIEVSDDAAIVAVTANGELFFTDGEAESEMVQDPAELGLIIRELVKIVPSKEFLIKADQMVRYEVIDEVLDELRNNGAKNIGMLTRRKSARPPIPQEGSSEESS